MIHNIVQACKVHSAELANVYLARVAAALLQALVLLQAALAKEFLVANWAMVQ